LRPLAAFSACLTRFPARVAVNWLLCFQFTRPLRGFLAQNGSAILAGIRQYVVYSSYPQYVVYSSYPQYVVYSSYPLNVPVLAFVFAFLRVTPWK